MIIKICSLIIVFDENDEIFAAKHHTDWHRENASICFAHFNAHFNLSSIFCCIDIFNFNVKFKHRHSTLTSYVRVFSSIQFISPVEHMDAQQMQQFSKLLLLSCVFAVFSIEVANYICFVVECRHFHMSWAKVDFSIAQFTYVKSPKIHDTETHNPFEDFICKLRKTCRKKHKHFFFEFGRAIHAYKSQSSLDREITRTRPSQLSQEIKEMLPLHFHYSIFFVSFS